MKQRIEIIIKGGVQGIGFRPFIYRAATELNIKGFVNNTSAGVFIEAEGEKYILAKFLLKIKEDKPAFSFIEELTWSYKTPFNYTSFEILSNFFDGEPDTIILPDLALCNDCLKELFDPSNRRYLYPFINCTNCGPRFSIISAIPYDRSNTTMNIFEMCDNCRAEYTNPSNRRFHAEPVACHTCGPSIKLWNKKGDQLCSGHEAVKQAALAILNGKIIALKGLGGFHILADALSDSAVQNLRHRKQRDEKPFALMFPSLHSIVSYCEVSAIEAKLLLGYEAPIVLLKSKKNLSEYIAPRNPYLGVMLPYTPLHHLILRELKIPVVATSGNLTDEPMCIDEYQALEKLNGIADYFLVHNRKILRPVDDSIVKIINGFPVIIRRARGYAPLPINDYSGDLSTMLAAGAHLKNSIALKKNKYVFISQQTGDLSTAEAAVNFERTVEDFKELYNIKTVKYISDLHPEYYSSKYTKQFDNRETVQHHIAHIASCYGENELKGETLGIAWDGTGLGTDNTIWGSEFFIYDGIDAHHFAQLLNYQIPGGEYGIKNSANSAAGILYKTMSESERNKNLLVKELFRYKNPEHLFTAIQKGINCYSTSSMGRLFDAVSFLLGLCEKISYEGEAAMQLEFCAATDCEGIYPFDIVSEEKLLFDWRPMIRNILDDISASVSKNIISAKFHNTLVELILYAAECAGRQNIVISGGCFQNSYLLERSIKLLLNNGFTPYWNKKVPANDSGISYGQIVYISNRRKRQEIKTDEEKAYVSGSPR